MTPSGQNRLSRAGSSGRSRERGLEDWREERKERWVWAPCLWPGQKKLALIRLASERRAERMGVGGVWAGFG